MRRAVLVLALVVAGCGSGASEVENQIDEAQARADAAYELAEQAVASANFANDRATQITRQLREAESEIARLERELSYRQ